MARSAIARNRMGCSSGKKTKLATKPSALSHAGGPGSLAISNSGLLFCARSSYRSEGLAASSIAKADETIRPFVTEVYTKMRETWEQLIEEVLFAGVIGRFRPNVATMRLRSARIEQADYEAVYAGMSRYSKFSGHDQSAGVPPDLPLFADMEEDLNKLRAFFNAADKRRKELEEEGKAYEDGPLVAEVLS